MEMFIYIFGILGGTIVLLILCVLLCMSSVIIRAIKVPINCVLIHKAGEAWWKGLIPFYNRWVRYHIGFNSRTALLVFIVDMVITALYGMLYFIVSILAYGPGILNGSSNANFFNTAFGTATVVLSMVVFLVKMIYSLVYRYGTYAICKAFGRKQGFCIAALFIPIITSLIVLFSESEYTGDVVKIIK